MKATREAARRRLERLLDEHGLLLVHDAKLPSATACIAGAPVPGSWWGHAKGKLIYETLEQVGETVAWAKLVLGKDTLVHRRLWPALVAAAESRQAWQTRGLARGRQEAAGPGPARRPDSHGRGPCRQGPQAGRRRDGAGTPAARPRHQRAHRLGPPRAVPGNVGGVGQGARHRGARAPRCDRGDRRAVGARPRLDGGPEARGVIALVRRRLSPTLAAAGPVDYRRPRIWRGGREAEGGGLLNRYTAQKLYRGFESLPLRNFTSRAGGRRATGAP